jgi:excisionase family DNA binding protein
MIDPEKVYRPKQAAIRMEISERKLRYLIGEGKIAAYRIGRCICVKERAIKDYENDQIRIYQEENGVSDDLKKIY